MRATLNVDGWGVGIFIWVVMAFLVAFLTRFAERRCLCVCLFGDESITVFGSETSAVLLISSFGRGVREGEFGE